MDPALIPRPLVVVKTGDTHAALADTLGDFEHWIARGLGPLALPLVVLDPRRGDTLPAPHALAGAVVTGSHAMVSDRAPWSEATARWLAVAAQHNVPLLGICYGHQLLAHALGGEVDDHLHGQEIGTVGIDLLPDAAHDPLFAGLPVRIDAHAAHRQSAHTLPPGSLRLAVNAWEQNQAFRFGACAWGVQFHPEFDEAAMRGYIDMLDHAHPNASARWAELRAGLRPTPQAARLLQRFAQFVEAREAASVLAAA